MRTIVEEVKTDFSHWQKDPFGMFGAHLSALVLCMYGGMMMALYRDAFTITIWIVFFFMLFYMIVRANTQW